MKFEKGQAVVVSHQPRHHIPPTTRAGTVTGVGRKYVTVTMQGHEMEFVIASGAQKTDYSPTHWLWASMRAFEESQEVLRLHREIREFFESLASKVRLDLEQLRRVKAILDECASTE